MADAPSHEDIATMMGEVQRATFNLWRLLAEEAPTAEMRAHCARMAALYDTQEPRP